MGIDLRLFPIDRLTTVCWGYSHTVLSLGGVSEESYDQLRAIAKPLPEGHSITSYLGRRVPDGSSKDEFTYGVLAIDAYGERYTWITARDLLPILDRWWAGHPATAYVHALPADRLIVLDWH